MATSNAREPWVLAIDIGTSSVRVFGFDADGGAIPALRAQAMHEARTDGGAHEIDADGLVEAAARCVDAVLRQAGPQAGAFAAVGVSSFWHSMVGVGAEGGPVSPIYTWADARPADAARRLRERLDPAAYHARTGCALHPSYFPARMLWLREADARTWARAVRWISPGEYLMARLLGEECPSISMASATGLFDQNRQEWDPETMGVVGVEPERLRSAPRWRRSGEPTPGLTPEWSQRWPALARLPWAPCIGDGAASNLGNGCATDRRIAINLGTSGAIRVLWRAASVEIPPELWCYRLDEERPVMGAAFSDGGNVFGWMRQALALPDPEAAEHLLASRPPACHGLTFLPFLHGERSPGWRPEATATLLGLRATTTALDLLQAGLEGVALRFALMADVLRDRFPQAREIVASGGALAESPVWASMLTDALGQPITLAPGHEATPRGAALTALRAAGVLADEADAPAPDGTVLRPDPGRHEALRAALERQRDLEARLA